MPEQSATQMATVSGDPKSKILALIASFVFSIPLMFAFGQYAIWLFGFGVWVLPFLLSTLPEPLALNYAGSSVTVVFFALFGSIQNVFMTFIYLNHRSHAVIKIAYWVLLVIVLVGAFLALLFVRPWSL